MNRGFRSALVLFMFASLAAIAAMAAELPEDFRLEPVLGGLTEPSALAATPRGDLLIAERTTGLLRVVRNGELSPTAACTVAVNAAGEGGLLGVAVHPSHQSNGWVYLYYTALASGHNKVTRYTLGPAGCTNAFDILADLGGGASLLRNGGGIGFGADGKLYVATGDMENASNAQSGASLAGKVLRLNDDGSIPGDNPTPGDAIYTSGIRDGHGLALHPTGKVYVGDHGSTAESVHDELNAAAAGGNLGWAIESGPGGSLDPPITSWLPTIGVGAIASYTAGAFPDLDGDSLDNDHDAYGPNLLPGKARQDDNAAGTCVGSTNNALPCTPAGGQCNTARPGEATHFCEGRDEAAEWCPSGSPIGDDVCGNTGAAGRDEPDESYLNNVFTVTGTGISRAVVTGGGLDQLSTFKAFLDAAALPDCPQGWTAVLSGPDGFLYATARNGGGAAGALYRVVHDDDPGPREVSAPGSPFPLRVEEGVVPGDVVVFWEDLREDSMQPRDNGAVPIAPVREYTVWKGTIGSYYSHAVAAGLGATQGTQVNDALRKATVSTTPGANEYFLVSARHDNLEGTLGNGTPGPRPGYAVTDLCTTIGLHGPGNPSLWTCGQNFSLVNEYGEPTSLYEHRGHPIFIDLSAIWCPPCITQANTSMEDIHQDYKDLGVVVLTVLMDEDSQTQDFLGRPTQAECRNWADRPGSFVDHTFECQIDPNGGPQQSWARYNLSNEIPRNVVLDQGLRVVYTTAGFPESTIRARLTALAGATDVCLH